MSNAEWHAINDSLNAGKDVARQAYAVIGAMMAARIEGKRTAERKPPCVVRMMVQGQVHCEFKGDLVLRDGQWTLTGIWLRMKADPVGTFNLYIKPDGEQRAKLWTKKLIDPFTDIARTILQIIAKGEAFFLAANDSNNCAFCGRGLSDPSSRELGIGPECAGGVYHRFRIPTAEQQQAIDLTEELLRDRIKAIRLEMKEAHPDLGGTGDGALFARLSGELKRLRNAIDGIKVAA